MRTITQEEIANKTGHQFGFLSAVWQYFRRLKQKTNQQLSIPTDAKHLRRDTFFSPDVFVFTLNVISEIFKLLP